MDTSVSGESVLINDVCPDCRGENNNEKQTEVFWLCIGYHNFIITLKLE